MSKTVIHSCSTSYQKSVTLHVSHYESSIADVQPCVEHLFCKKIDNGTFAAYGFYSVFFLFTCVDFNGKYLCFHMLVRQAFSLLFEGEVPDTDIYEVQFVPRVTAHPTDPHAATWSVEIHADAKAIFYAETPAESPKAMIPVIDRSTTGEKQQVSQEEEKLSNPQPQVKDPDVLLPEAKTKDSETEDSETRQDAEAIPGNYWRILSDASVPMDELLDMDEIGRREFMEDLS